MKSFKCQHCGDVNQIQFFAQIAGAIWPGADPEKDIYKNMTVPCFVVICSRCLQPIKRGDPEIEKYVKEFFEHAAYGFENHQDLETFALTRARIEHDITEHPGQILRDGKWVDLPEVEP